MIYLIPYFQYQQILLVSPPKIFYIQQPVIIIFTAQNSIHALPQTS